MFGVLGGWGRNYHLRIITLGVKQRVLLGVFLASASHADFYMVLHQFGVNVAIVVV